MSLSQYYETRGRSSPRRVPESCRKDCCSSSRTGIGVSAAASVRAALVLRVVLASVMPASSDWDCSNSELDSLEGSGFFDFLLFSPGGDCFFDSLGDFRRGFFDAFAELGCVARRLPRCASVPGNNGGYDVVNMRNVRNIVQLPYRARTSVSLCAARSANCCVVCARGPEDLQEERELPEVSARPELLHITPKSVAAQYCGDKHHDRK